MCDHSRRANLLAATLRELVDILPSDDKMKTEFVSRLRAVLSTDPNPGAPKWQSPETAPKDGTPFLAALEGYPWAVCCAWNGVEEQWIYTTIQINLFNGQWIDTYFENERAGEPELTAWMPMPAPEKQTGE